MTDTTRRVARRAVSDGGTADRVLVLNPASGDGTHVSQVRELAAEHGFEVRTTGSEGDIAAFAAEAAREGATLVAAAGGDGTLNEAVRGLAAADALGDVVFGVVPAGTGNNFAGNVGVQGIEHAFSVMDEGWTRTIDLGVADGRPFLNSCVGGLTAEASAETTADLKSELGVMAYILNTFRTAVDYEGLTLEIETTPDHDEAWRGEAVMILVGNGRRFPARGGTQANMEDGLLDVTIVENRPRFELTELAVSATIERLFGADAEGVVRLKTPALSVQVRDDESTTFSLDGEMVSARELTIGTDPRTLTLRVGAGYDPDPPDPRGTRGSDESKGV